MELPKKWGEEIMHKTGDLKILGLMCKDDTIIDYLHDFTARVEKLEPKECMKEKCRYWVEETNDKYGHCGGCYNTPGDCSRYIKDYFEPASQPEQPTISKKETVEPGKEEWRELWKKADKWAKEVEKLRGLPMETCHKFNIAMTAAANKIEEMEKAIKFVIEKSRSELQYTSEDMADDLEELIK